MKKEAGIFWISWEVLRKIFWFFRESYFHNYRKEEANQVCRERARTHFDCYTADVTVELGAATVPRSDA